MSGNNFDTVLGTNNTTEKTSKPRKIVASKAKSIKDSNDEDLEEELEDKISGLFFNFKLYCNY